MKRIPHQLPLAVGLVLGLLSHGCSRSPSGLVDYDVWAETRVPIGLEVDVVVPATATEQEIRGLDEYLADKYQVRDGGDGYCIWYVDDREAVGLRRRSRSTDAEVQRWGSHCVALHPRGEELEYIPPAQRTQG